MIRTRVLCLTLGLPVIFAPACNSARQGEQGTGSVEASAVIASARASANELSPLLRTAKPFHYGGLAGMMFHAVSDLRLSAEQTSAVEKLENELQGTDVREKAASRELQSDLVAGIRAGKVDAARMRADYAALDNETRARQERDARALVGLHAALDPHLREELVRTVRTLRAVHDAVRLPDAPDEPDAAAIDWTRRRIERLTDDLGLNEAQQKQVALLLARSDLPSATAMKMRKDTARARADALLLAFVQETFDAGAPSLAAAAAKSPHELVEREVVFVSQLLPILKADQREQLAAMREGPNRGWAEPTDEPPPY